MFRFKREMKVVCPEQNKSDPKVALLWMRKDYFLPFLVAGLASFSAGASSFSGVG